jgi:hypothetical protein
MYDTIGGRLGYARGNPVSALVSRALTEMSSSIVEGMMYDANDHISALAQDANRPGEGRSD